MKAVSDVLVLIGSPRSSRSTSHSLAAYLAERLNGMGIIAEMMHVYPLLTTPGGLGRMLEAADKADTLVFVSPLYVDSVPSGVVCLMEAIAERRSAAGMHKHQRLLAISNCGFPEARHNDPALKIYRLFSRDAGIEWSGGLGLGMGEAVAGRPLQGLGNMARHLRRALDMTAGAIAEGQPVPAGAIQLMAKPFIPSWLYILLGEMGWKRLARKAGALKEIRRRPYEGGNVY